MPKIFDVAVPGILKAAIIGIPILIGLSLIAAAIIVIIIVKKNKKKK